MSLTPGTRLGPYEIVSAIGAGGMGEVYRARDSKLDRDVAIKVLPESFALDADRLARFAREAKTLASLNHPNIAAIYGIEDHALVMELVEGEDLSVHIARGPIALADALPIAKQIADALEAAHEQGIVHRDLKPANIKVRSDGTVKVLDFGLAKAMDPAGASGSDAMNSPTLTARATQMGMILGTAAYMAPEQAKGKVVDRRADIWAFGVVLYEMLAGRRLFEADDVSETLAAVLTRDVGPAMSSAAIPPGLRSVIGDCLSRDLKKRFRDIGDVRLLLDKALDAGSSAPASARPASTRWLWPGLAALGVVLAIVMTSLYLRQPHVVPPDALTFEVAAPDLSQVAAISPDGRQIIYGTVASQARPASQLWLRSLGSLEPRPVPGTQSVVLSFAQAPIGISWSPDSRATAFFTANALMRVDLNTGQTAELVKGGMGILMVPGGWNRDGVVLYGRRSGLEAHGSGIFRVADTGGTPAALTELRSGENFHLPSGFLPDGHRFLYFVLKIGDFDTGEVRVGSIDAAPATQSTAALLTADGPAVYASGYLLFVSRGSLMAQPFDSERAVLTGTPTLIASGVNPWISVSTTGHLIYRSGDDGAGQLSELIRFSRDGHVLGKIGVPAIYGDVNLFSVGRQLAVTRTDRGEPNHLHIVDLARGVFSRLSPGSTGDYASAPSSDGTIAYTFSPDGVSRDIYVRAANGVGEARRLVASETVKHPNHWSPDGRFLIYDDHVPGHVQDLMLVRKEGGAPIPFLATDADETFGQFSPDGKWIAYRSTESGRNEVYVRDFAPDRSPAYGTEKTQISVNGGDKPRWSPNGREIFFIQGNTLMTVPVRPEKPFQVGTAVRLFDIKTSSYIPYDVMPDGSFVVSMLLASPGGAASPLRVLLNWSALLRK